MRVLLIGISLAIGWFFGSEFAWLVWILGRLVIGVLEQGAESNARYQKTDTHSYRSSYQRKYQNSYQSKYQSDCQSGYQNNYQYSKASDDYQKTESTNPSYYYSVLGVSSNATDLEIKKAYRKLAMECHPDRYANSREEVRKRANEKFCKVNEAYEIVKKWRQMK